MSRKLIVKIIGLLFLPLAILIILFSYFERAKNFQMIPDLDFVTIYGERIMTADLSNAHVPCAFVFFHPDCSFCRKEVDEILNSCVGRSHYKWFLISIASPTEIETMLMDYPAGIISQVYFISEEDDLQAYTVFNVTSPPEVFFYDEEGNLRWHRKGLTKKGSLIKMSHLK